MEKLFVSAKQITPRMFKSGFIEAFSKTHWTIPAIIFIPIIAFLCYLSISGGVNIIGGISFLVLGFFFWTFAEYVLHRFVFHYKPKSEIGKKIHWIFHGVHHDYPQDPLRLVMPPSVSIPLAFLFYLLFQLTIGNITSPSHAEIFTAGFLIGYLFYDLGHYFLHHAAFKSGYLLKVKQHHMNHHYKDPDHGFGVSSPLWDKVFGSGFQKK